MKIFTTSSKIKKELKLISSVMLLLLGFTAFNAQAQTINVEDGLCIGSIVLTLGGVHNGKNYYVNTVSGFVLYWDSVDNRWELDFGAIPGVNSYVMSASTVPTSPNPPDLSFGNWFVVGGVCGSLLQLNGSGTQSSLPVELISFTAATSQEETTKLRWSTASEDNNEGFYIEHSVDAHNWEYVDFINGIGTTVDKQQYDYTHRTPQAGINYYRLKQTDYDGAFEYSDIVTVEIAHAAKGISIVPNPVSSNRNVTVNLDKGVTGTLRVFNMMGQLIYQASTSEGESSYPFSISDVASGIYMVTVKNGLNQFSERLVVN